MADDADALAQVVLVLLALADERSPFSRTTLRLVLGQALDDDIDEMMRTKTKMTDESDLQWEAGGVRLGRARAKEEKRMRRRTALLAPRLDARSKVPIAELVEVLRRSRGVRACAKSPTRGRLMEMRAGELARRGVASAAASRLAGQAAAATEYGGSGRAHEHEAGECWR